MSLLRTMILIGLFGGLQLLLPAQTLEELATLPASINESSGLEVSDINTIWTHNDSPSNPEFHQIDTNGTILRTIFLQGASVTDWEDMTQDVDGNFYLGDFGNNSHNRTNLKIYTIGNPDTSASDTLVVDTIEFSYPDQTAFPPSASNENFDCEGMVAWGDSLYLFSKNWTDPFTGYTKRYRLPNTPGTYVAELLDSFYTGPGPSGVYWITAADLSPDGSVLTLLSSDKLWLFTGYSGADFFGGTSQQVSLGAITQKEAIVFYDSTHVYLTDEEFFGFGRKLYRLDLSGVLMTVGEVDLLPYDGIAMGPNPVKETLNVQLPASMEGPVQVEVFTLAGKLVYDSGPLHRPAGLGAIHMAASDLFPKNGVYVLRARVGERVFWRRVIFGE